jgi:hypothetical protein
MLNNTQVRVVKHSGVCQRGPATDSKELLYGTPDNEVAHPTTRSQNTSLLDDNLVLEITRC